HLGWTSCHRFSPICFSPRRIACPVVSRETYLVTAMMPTSLRSRPARRQAASTLASTASILSLSCSSNAPLSPHLAEGGREPNGPARLTPALRRHSALIPIQAAIRPVLPFS